MTLLAAIKEFLIHCTFEKKLSPKTLKIYETDLSQLNEQLSEIHRITAVKDITKEHLRSYLIHISNLKPKSIKRKLAVIKSLFNFLEFDEKILISPLRQMRIKIKEPLTLPSVMELSEIIRMFKLCHQYKSRIANRNSYTYFESVRNIVVLELLFLTGARVSEIANLKKDDINIQTGNLVIRGKGGKQRIIQICNKEALSTLKQYYSLLKKIEYLESYLLVNRLGKKISDQSIRILVKNLATKVGIKKRITPHVFRHSFATLLLEKDVDIKYIQEMLGHSSIVTTQIYTHVNRERQRRILRDKHPRKNFSYNDFSYPIE